jgi:integrase
MNSKQSGRRRFLKNAALAALAAGAGQSASAQGVTAGLQGLRLHDLRHQFVTGLAESGVSDQIIMALAGHVSKKMLEYCSKVRFNAMRIKLDPCGKSVWKWEMSISGECN